MARAFAIWGAASLLGVALVAWLPEQWLGGAVLFRLSDRHGPSVADGVGILILLAGWLYYVGALWRRRRSLSPRWVVLVLITVAIAAALGCIYAATADQDGWLIALTALALTAQIALGLMARRA